MKLIIFLKEHYSKLVHGRQVEIVSRSYEGKFHNSFIVADECQNASYDQLKMP